MNTNGTSVSLPDHAIVRLRQRLSRHDLLTAEPSDDKLRVLLERWIDKALDALVEPELVLSEGRVVMLLSLEAVSGRPLIAVLGKNLVPKGKGAGKSHVLLTLLDKSMREVNQRNGMWKPVPKDLGVNDFEATIQQSVPITQPGARMALVTFTKSGACYVVPVREDLVSAFLRWLDSNGVSSHGAFVRMGGANG